MTIRVNVKSIRGENYGLDVDAATTTIFQLKELASEKLKIPANDQKLVFKGVVTADDKTLDEYSAGDGCTFQVIKIARKAPPPQQQIALPNSAPHPSDNTSGMNSGGFNPGGFNPGMMQEAMQGMGLPPGMMEMMRNPQVQQMLGEFLRNPELAERNPMFQQMMNTNPQFRSQWEMLKRNPGLLNSMGLTGNGGGGGGGGVPTQAEPTSNLTLTHEQLLLKYQAQLDEMQSMGFFDKKLNLECIQAANGSLNIAIEKLLEKM